jgi:hypothetical protein
MISEEMSIEMEFGKGIEIFFFSLRPAYDIEIAILIDLPLRQSMF